MRQPADWHDVRLLGLKRDVCGTILTDKTGYRAERTVPMQNYILAILLTAVGAKAELSRLEALSMIESGDDDAAIGRAGEISRFQIMPSVWAHYSGSRAFRDCRVARDVAARHLTELTTWFQNRAGRPASDFDVYVLWNAGPTYYTKVGFKTSRVHPMVCERARRYARLRNSVSRRRIEMASMPANRPQTPPRAQPKAVASAPLATKEPLWPVFNQPAAPVRPVPAFALSPVLISIAHPKATTSTCFTLGTLLLTPGE